MPTAIHVNIGQIKTGSGDATLRANLGSCLGIGFFWQARMTFGLAHCFLPVAEQARDAISARYVTHAIPSLIELMRIPNGLKSEIRVVIAGGGEMISTSPNNNSKIVAVGCLNIQTARRCLREFGFTIDHEDVAGRYGRLFQIQCATGDYEIIQLPRSA